MMQMMHRSQSSLSPSGKRYASTDFVCGALRLHSQQEVIEKSQSIIISSLRSLELNFIKEINELHSVLDAKRLQVSEKLNETLQKIVNFFKNIEKSITGKKIIDLDLQVLRLNLYELENRIADFKEASDREYFQLCQQEKVLWDQVSDVSLRIDEWSRPVKIDTNVLVERTRLAYICGRTHYDENIENFQKLLRNAGGHSGGWDDSDHLIYLRYNQRYSNKKVLFSYLQKEFPDKTLDEICKHDEWYMDYETLRAKQRQSIAEWRQQRSRSAPRPVAAVPSKDSSVLEEIETKPKWKSAAGSRPSREQQKQQLEVWKHSKQIEEEQKAIKEEEKKKKELAEKGRRLVKLALKKAEVKQYQIVKKKQLQAMALAKRVHEQLEASKRAALANKNLKVFRQRDSDALARALETRDIKVAEKRAQEKAKERLRQTVRVQAHRDPYRLLRPTDAWRERIREDSHSKAPSGILNLSEVPRLGIPKWRKQTA